MSKQPPPAPTASTVGPCPTIIQIVGCPGTGSLPRTIAPPDHPQQKWVGWLVGCFGFNGPLRQYFSLYRAVSQRFGWLFWVKRPFETVFQSISSRLPKRGRKRRERIDERKMSKQPPPAPTASAVGPCPTVSKL